MDFHRIIINLKQKKTQKNKMKAILLMLLLLALPIHGQSLDASVLSLEEYLGWVKKFHPIAQQANLGLAMGEAKLLKSRGAFDPKIEIDYDRKKFKETEYFDKLNAVFKIPTWYGIELKGKFDQNRGDFLNPEAIVPSEGLYSAGISFSLAEGLWINDRMAQLKQAKLYQQQSVAERDLLINQLLLDASVAYFEWWNAHKETEVFTNFYNNAEIRLNAVKRSIVAGDKPAIDSVEAGVTLQSRKLGLKEVQLKKLKTGLQLSNFLWMDGAVPLEISENAIPQEIDPDAVERILLSNLREAEEDSLTDHPKIRSLQLKLDQLTLERRLKVNKLLPQIDLEYNFYSERLQDFNSFSTSNYYAGLNLSVPLFLRKERGDLNLARYKEQDARWEMLGTNLQLRNKIRASKAEITSYKEQMELMNQIVDQYQTLVLAEERRFNLGESSLFLVNTRENGFIESQLKQLKLSAKLFESQARLFNVMALPVLETN